MNFRNKRRGPEEPEINFIPLIDVLLVILIFLMVTTTYSKFTELQLTLPTADAEKALDRPFELNVSINAQGDYAIDNARVAFRNPAGLSDELKRAAGSKGDGSKEPIVIVAADGLAPHQSVINVLEAARLAGYAKVTFAAQSSGGK